MVTSAYIQILRRSYNDTPKLHRDTRKGDGSSTVYQAMYKPILEGSFSLRVNNVSQVEGVASDFTLDYDSGDIDFAVAPSNNLVIEAIYKEVKFRNAHWLDAIQHGFQSLGDKFYRTTLFSTSAITLSANVRKYNCPSDCIRVLSWFESTDYTQTGVYSQMRRNWEYDRRANQLILGADPSRANYTALSYLRKLAAPSATTSTLDLETNWEAVVAHKAGAYYLRSMANRIAQQGNATVEEGHFNPQMLRALARDEEEQFELLKRTIKPVLPSIPIRAWTPGQGVVPR